MGSSSTTGACSPQCTSGPLTRCLSSELITKRVVTAPGTSLPQFEPFRVGDGQDMPRILQQRVHVDATIRLLNPEDIGSKYQAKHFCRLLSHLTDSPEVDNETLRSVLALQQKSNHVTVVALSDESSEDTGYFMGSVSLLIEQKVIHGASRVGHIEDVVVAPQYRLRGLGSAMLSSAVEFARRAGCYKVILDADVHVAAFYEHVGLSAKETQMVVRFN